MRVSLLQHGDYREYSRVWFHLLRRALGRLIDPGPPHYHTTAIRILAAVLFEGS